jgi:hypothetical protein
MINLLVIILFFIWIVGCNSTGPGGQKYSNVELTGISRETAIQLSAFSHSEGLEAEHLWLKTNLPGAKLAEGEVAENGAMYFFSHRTESNESGIYSVYSMQLLTGEIIDVYFDQSGYFGKVNKE